MGPEILHFQQARVPEVLVARGPCLESQRSSPVVLHLAGKQGGLRGCFSSTSFSSREVHPRPVYLIDGAGDPASVLFEAPRVTLMCSQGWGPLFYRVGREFRQTGSFQLKLSLSAAPWWPSCSCTFKGKLIRKRKECCCPGRMGCPLPQDPLCQEWAPPLL